MRYQRLLSALALTAIVSLLLVGCSGSSPLQPIGAETGGKPIAAPIGVPAAGEQPGPGQDQTDQLADSAYIVREGTLNVEVKDLPATLNQAQALVTGLGGYIAGSKEAHDSGSDYATITYRVPVEKWFDALAGLRALGTKVLAENSTALDVTADVVDMDARLANLRAAETQYQAIMAKAVTIDDVLKVQKQLNDTRGEIEQLQAQRDNLANRAALATLTVAWQVPTTAVATVNQGWDLGHEIDAAVASLVGTAQGLASVFVWLLIAVLPILIPIVLLALIAYRILRPRLNRVRIEDTPAADA
jgi:hypothetical protein